MNRFLTAAVTAVAVAGCVSAAPHSDRDVLPRNPEVDRPAPRGARWSTIAGPAPAVVIASDPQSSRCWIITTRHLVEPPKPRRLSARVPDHGGSLSAEVVKISDELDLAILSSRGSRLPP